MTFSVPAPCSKSWDAMTPTVDGRYCGSCQHEVVDFSRMTEAQVLAWLDRLRTGIVCGFFEAGQFAPPAVPRWRRWLVAAVALLGLRPLLAADEAAGFSPLRPIPRATEQADAHAEAPNDQVTIRGHVLDDSTGLGVSGAEIFIADTQYGAVTDEQGNFSFTMLKSWTPVRKGRVQLRVQGSPFVFKAETVSVEVSPAPAPLSIRLKSIPGRGHIRGRVARHEPPRKPPLK
jgi:hypothetical protein